MSNYLSMDRAAREREFTAVRSEYETLRAAGARLDMSRGKPGFDQMDLSHAIFDTVTNAIAAITAGSTALWNSKSSFRRFSASRRSRSSSAAIRRST